MPCCAVKGCQSSHRRSSRVSSGENTVTFHTFPEDFSLKEKWSKFCGRPVPVRAVVCSLHFQPGLIKNCGIKGIIQPDAIPTLNGPETTHIAYPFLTAGKTKMNCSSDEDLTSLYVLSSNKKTDEIAFSSENPSATMWSKFPNFSPDGIPEDPEICSKQKLSCDIDDRPKLSRSVLPSVPKSQEYQTVFVEYKGNKSKKYVIPKRFNNRLTGPTVNLSFNNQPTIIQDLSNTIESGARSNTVPKIIPVASVPTPESDSSKYLQSERGPKRLRLDGSSTNFASISTDTQSKQRRNNPSSSSTLTIELVPNVDKSREEIFKKMSTSTVTVELLPNVEKTTDEIANEMSIVFKNAAQPPWTYIETDNSIKLCRVDHIEEFDLTILGMVVTFDKSSGHVSVTSRGEELQASCFSPKDFEFPHNVIKMETANVENFVNTIKRTPLKWNPFGVLNSARTTIKSVMESVKTSNDSTFSRPTPLEMEKERLRNYFPSLKMVHDQLQAITAHNPWIENSVEMASELRSLSVPCYNYLRSTKSLLLPPERLLKKLKAPIDKFGARKTKQFGEAKRTKPVIIPFAGQDDNEIRTIFVAHDPLLISNYQPIVVEETGDSLQGIIFDGGNIEEVVSECSVFSQVASEESLKERSDDPSGETIYSASDCNQEDELVDSSCISSHEQISTQHEFEVGVELLESWADTN